MTIARRDIVDDETACFYHCTNRCVRRTFLCGFDEFTGKNFSHRKDWLEKRILDLCQIFSVDVYAFAVMDNHYHIVLYLDPLAPQSWSKEEIAERWLKAYGGRLSEPKNSKLRELKKQAIIADKEKSSLYRERLGSLSWFMSRLNEPLAKRSNREDNCTGRFWEGRYSAQALLDEASVLSCMCYVDLNPVRAKITKTLEQSNHTSIQKRIENLKQLPSKIQEVQLKANIKAITNNIQQQRLFIPLKDYIELVEWTGKNIVYPNKAKLPNHIISSLERLNLQSGHWLKHIEQFNNNYCHVVGTVEQMQAFAKKLEKKWLKGIVAAKKLLKPPIISE